MSRPSRRRGRGPAAPRSCKDDDTGLDDDDTPAGDIWRPAPSRAAGAATHPAARVRRPFRHRPPTTRPKPELAARTG
jgi:hypothetical protein